MTGLPLYTVNGLESCGLQVVGYPGPQGMADRSLSLLSGTSRLIILLLGSKVVNFSMAANPNLIRSESALGFGSGCRQMSLPLLTDIRHPLNEKNLGLARVGFCRFVYGFGFYTSLALLL